MAGLLLSGSSYVCRSNLLPKIKPIDIYAIFKRQTGHKLVIKPYVTAPSLGNAGLADLHRKKQAAIDEAAKDK